MEQNLSFVLMLCLLLVSALVIAYSLGSDVRIRLLSISLILGMGLSGYYFWGNWALWQDHLSFQKKQEEASALLKTIGSPEALIDKLKIKLTQSPESAQGWYLLGRLYSSQNHKQSDVVKAFARAYLLDPGNEQYAVNYAHSLWELQNHEFSDRVLVIFHTLLTKNPNQPDALAMLAMYAYRKQAYEDAIHYWERLLQLVAPQSEEAKTLRKALAQAQGELIRRGRLTLSK